MQQSLIFKQDNTPSKLLFSLHLIWQSDRGISVETIIDWFLQSSFLSLIENLWSIIEKKVYENRRQFGNKMDL